jgi:HK97 gp10 family phage protein
MKRNLYAADKILTQQIQRVAKETAEAIHRDTHDATPEISGRMRRLLRTKYSEGGANFQVGWYRKDFFAEGSRFYPPYVELGTRKRAAQPNLQNAYRKHAPSFEARTGLLVRGAFKREQFSGRWR